MPGQSWPGTAPGHEIATAYSAEVAAVPEQGAPAIGIGLGGVERRAGEEQNTAASAMRMIASMNSDESQVRRLARGALAPSTGTPS